MDDEERITTANADEIERDFQEKKRNKRLGKKAKPPASSSDEPATEKKEPKAKGKKKQASFLPVYDEPDPYLEDDAFPEFDDLAAYPDPDDIAEIVRKCRMINEYYEVFPDVRTKKKWNPDKVSNTACDVELERIRNIRDMKGARKAFNGAFVSTFSVFEKFTHEYGYNPFDLDVHGIGGAVSANLPKFETELTEAYIELGSHFATSWPYRLAYKCVEFTQAYSALQKNPELQKKMREAMEAAQQALREGRTQPPVEE